MPTGALLLRDLLKTSYLRACRDVARTHAHAPVDKLQEAAVDLRQGASRLKGAKDHDHKVIYISENYCS